MRCVCSSEGVLGAWNVELKQRLVWRVDSKLDSYAT